MPNGNGLRIVHLSDVHRPVLWPSGGWERRWRRLAHQVRDAVPDVVVVSGDLVNHGRPAFLARRSLDAFVAVARETLGCRLLLVPGNHDLKALFGNGPVDAAARERFRTAYPDLFLHGADASAVVGDLVHLVGADSSSGWVLAQGRLDAPLELPAACRDDRTRHVHVLVVHHHLHPEPRRRGELVPDAALRLLDAPEVRERIVRHGFNLVLHGHRHLSTLYPEHDQDRVGDPIWFVGAPSAASEDESGFNVVDVHDDGTLELSQVRLSQDRWVRTAVLGRRTYDAVKAARRATERARGRHAFERVEVELYPLDETEDFGDVGVHVRLSGIELRGDALAFPVHLASYRGAQLRGVSATWTTEAGNPAALAVNEDGSFDVRRVVHPARIDVHATVQNVLPTRPGDWARMRTSDPALSSVFEVRGAYLSRFLRTTVRLGGGPRLSVFPVVHGRPTRAELDYVASGASEDGTLHVTSFWPDPAVAYCFTPDGEPGGGLATATGPTTAELRDRVAALRHAAADSIARRLAIEALDRLRASLVRLGPELGGDPDAAGDDVMIDLMSIPGARPFEGAPPSPGLTVVLTDGHTAAAIEAGAVHPRVGFSLPWGTGVGGRALRAQGWIAWTWAEHVGHESTWDAADAHRHEPGVPSHRYLFCGPLVAEEGDGNFAYGVVSCATYSADSLLERVVLGMEDDASRERILAAFEQLGDTLSEALLSGARSGGS